MDRYPYYKYTILLGTTRALAHIGIHFNTPRFRPVTIPQERGEVLGLPKFIMSDRDSRFTWKFWMELFKLMGTELHFSTRFHPQTDGQMERVNALLELYLRNFVSANQTDWAKLLDVAQFSYNLQRSEATERSPFEIVMR